VEEDRAERHRRETVGRENVVVAQIIRISENRERFSFILVVLFGFQREKNHTPIFVCEPICRDDI
jgi:hypothetical protein